MTEQDITRLLVERLLNDLDQVSGEGLDKDEKKHLSEEIKAITTFLNNQDSTNLEWEKFEYQKQRDVIEDKQKKIDRVFVLVDGGIKLIVAGLSAFVTITGTKALFMYETDRPITSQGAKMLYGRVMNPKL